MASDKVVQNAVQTLNAELCQIGKVLERIAVALERQVEQIASLTPSPPELSESGAVRNRQPVS